MRTSTPLTAHTGIAVAAVAVALMMIPGAAFPLEFAQAPADVRQVLFAGDAPDAGAATATRIAIRVDFVFIGLYVVFLTAFAGRLAGMKTWLGWIGVALALLVGLADLVENRQMLAVLAQMDSLGRPDVGAALGRLHLATWVKWGGLAVYLALTAYGLGVRGRLKIGFAGVAGLSLVLTAAAAVLRPGPADGLFWLCEAFAMAQFAAVGLLILHSLGAGRGRGRSHHPAALAQHPLRRQQDHDDGDEERQRP